MQANRMELLHPTWFLDTLVNSKTKFLKNVVIAFSVKDFINFRTFFEAIHIKIAVDILLLTFYEHFKYVPENLSL